MNRLRRCCPRVLAWMVAATIALPAKPATAAAPTGVLTGYALTTWAESERGPFGAIAAIAQDADGYLWIGASAGLFRFDGVRFTPWDVHRRRRACRQDPSPRFSSAATAACGWDWPMAAASRRIRDGSVDAVRARASSARSPRWPKSSHGTIWAVADPGLYRLDGRRWTRVPVLGRTARNPHRQRRHVRRGQLLAGTRSGLFVMADDRTLSKDRRALGLGGHRGRRRAPSGSPISSRVSPQVASRRARGRLRRRRLSADARSARQPLGGDARRRALARPRAAAASPAGEGHAAVRACPATRSNRCSKIATATSGSARPAACTGSHQRKLTPMTTSASWSPWNHRRSRHLGRHHQRPACASRRIGRWQRTGSGPGVADPVSRRARLALDRHQREPVAIDRADAPESMASSSIRRFRGARDCAAITCMYADPAAACGLATTTGSFTGTAPLRRRSRRPPEHQHQRITLRAAAIDTAVSGSAFDEAQVGFVESTARSACWAPKTFDAGRTRRSTRCTKAQDGAMWIGGAAA